MFLTLLRNLNPLNAILVLEKREDLYIKKKKLTVYNIGISFEYINTNVL